MSSDPYHHIIDKLAHATLHAYTNEIALDQLEDGNTGHPDFDDPVKFRFGAFRPWDNRPSYYIAAISMDVLGHSATDNTPDQPFRIEIGFIALKLDPDPCIEIYLQTQAAYASDADMKCVLRISAKGLELDPKHAGGMSARGFGASGTPDKMVSPDGRFVTQQQNDGNFVTYDTSVTPWKAVWSAWGGRIIETATIEDNN